MALSRIAFGEWTPDQPGITTGLQRAENVFPKANGYGAVPTVVDYSTAASEDLNNVVAGRTTVGGTILFAGGATKLFKLDSAKAIKLIGDDCKDSGGQGSTIPIESSKGKMSAAYWADKVKW